MKLFRPPNQFAPARMQAQAVAKAKSLRLRPEVGEMLAQHVADPEMVAETMECLANNVNLFRAAEMLDTQEALDMIQAALDEAREMAEQDPPENPEEAKLRLRSVAMKVALDARSRSLGPSMKFVPGGGTRHDPFMRPGDKLAKMIDGFTAIIDKSYKPTKGREFAGMRLSDFAMMIAQGSGYRGNSRAEAARMAMHSTSDFPKILEGALRNTMARRMEILQPAILRAATRKVNADYRASKSLELSSLQSIGQIAEGGEVPYSTMKEAGEANPVVKDYGGMFGITNTAIANDNLGFFDDVSRRMTDAAIGVQRMVLLAPLMANAGAGQNMADGNTLFHASRGNTAASGGALGLDTLSAARTAMRRQKGPAGEILAVEPWALLVPPELETTAQQLLEDIQAAKVSDANPFSGTLELIVEPGLTDAAAWYVLANPSVYDGLTWATLEGMETPALESRPGWNTLGVEFRVLWALDAAFTASQTWYRNPGA